MPVTQEDVANMALTLLTEATIDSLDEDIRPARLINLHWDTVLEAELKKYPWSFAIVTSDLKADVSWTGTGYQYDVPDDMLRLLPLTYDGTHRGYPINFHQQNGYLYSDQSSPRSIRYIGNVVDPNEWDALFTQAFAAALAMKIGHALTGKTSMVQLAKQSYDDAIREARRVNSIERSGLQYTGWWAGARGDTRFERP